MAASRTTGPVSIASLLMCMVSSALLGGLAAGMLGISAGWVETRGAVLAVGLAVLSGLSTLGLTLGLVGPAVRQKSRNFGLVLIMAGMFRGLVSILAGLGLFMALNPEGKTFWTAFLAVGGLVLVAETAWGMRVAKRVCGTSPVKRVIDGPTPDGLGVAS